MRSVSFESRELQNVLKNRIEVPSDPEIYVGDAAVLERLAELIRNVQQGLYDEQTKQSLYYYGEHYLLDQPETPSEYVRQANDAAKYYITGWWVHSLIENQGALEEKLIQNESTIENKQ
jgi:hypothetical protein